MIKDKTKTELMIRREITAMQELLTLRMEARTQFDAKIRQARKEKAQNEAEIKKLMTNIKEWSALLGDK